MKKSTQSILILFLFLIVISAGALTAISQGTNIGPGSIFDNFFSSENGKNFKGGNASLATSGIEDIQINWPVGKVEVATYAGDTIQFQETTNGKLTEDSQLRYTVQDKELIIQYRKANSFDGFFEEFDGKNLKLLIPQGITLDEIKINGVSSDLLIQDVSAKTVELNNVSGDLNIDFMVIPEELDISSVSGNIKIALMENLGFKVDYKTVSGNFSSDFPLEIRDGESIYKNGASDFEVNTVSGNIEIINKIL